MNKPHMNTRRRLAALLLIAVVTYFCFSIFINYRDKQKVKSMTSTMKTVCVGRFLIDVPIKAKASFRGAFLNGWDIAIDPRETTHQFEQRLGDIASEFRKTTNSKGGQNIEEVIEISNEAIGKIFLFGRKWSTGMNGEKDGLTAASVHGYARVKGVSVDITSDGADREHIPEVLKILEKISPLSDGDIPLTPGFCYGHALLSAPLSADQNERVTMFLRLEEHPDILIALDSAAGLRHDKTLLQRHSDNTSTVSPLIRTMRIGKKEIDGMEGEHLLERFNEMNGTTGHSFTWETLGDKKDVLRPFLSLEFSTGHPLRTGGKPVESSLSDDAALMLWDKISSSLRLRPTKATVPNTEKKEDVPPQTGMSANQPCPTTGWWECTDGNYQVDVENGKTQFFRQGDRMPQAVLLPQATLLQRLQGEQPSFQSEIPTLWKFVGNGEYPKEPNG